MIISKTLEVPDRAAWRSWLAENASTKTEIWLVYFKKHAGKPGISYTESLEEALCFGWVDSLIQKIDEEKYARKFTPRKIGSAWSEINKHLVAKLVREGQMTAAGLARVDFPLPETDTPKPRPPALTIPGWLKTGLQASPLAWENYQKLPPSHQRRYVAWIMNAKREQTRQDRLHEAIILLEDNKRLGIGTGEVRK